MTFDPLGNGNCQFSAIAHQLYSLGIHRAASKVRKEIVKYLEENQNDQQGHWGSSWVFHSVSIYERWLLMELMVTI